METIFPYALAGISAVALLLVAVVVQSRARYRNQQKIELFASISEPIFLLDANGRIVDFSSGSTQVFGRPIRNMAGMKLSALFDEFFAQLFDEAIRMVSHDGSERIHICSMEINGQLHTFEARINPLKTGQRKLAGVVSVLMSDISNRIELERHLSSLELKQRHYAEKLEEVNATKDKLFSIVAHDLRGPVGNLRALIALHQEKKDSANPEDLNQIMTELGKALDGTWDLLENLLGWVRSKINDVPVQHEYVVLATVCEEVMSWLQPVAKTKGLNLFMHTAWGEQAVFTDKHMLETIVRNLVNNAIKFTPAGGSIYLKPCRNEGEHGIAVCDSGLGIEAGRIPYLFQMRGGSSTPGTGGERGSGLGLPMCKDLANQLGARLEVQSSAGNGSTFCLWIPEILEGELVQVDSGSNDES